MNEKINIFGLEIERYKLYGISISSRKPRQTQNISATFKVSTLIENIEYEYSIKLQWLNKYEKERIMAYIRNNTGKKIGINKKYFFEFEGGEIEKVGDDYFVKLLINYDEVDVNSNNNSFFDIQMKSKLILDFKPMTYNSLKDYTYNQLKAYSYNQIENGGM